MQYLLKQSEMENKWRKQKGENPSIDQNCNQQKDRKRIGERKAGEVGKNRI